MPRKAGPALIRRPKVKHSTKKVQKRSKGIKQRRRSII